MMRGIKQAVDDALSAVERGEAKQGIEQLCLELKATHLHECSNCGQTWLCSGQMGCKDTVCMDCTFGGDDAATRG